MLKRQLTEYMRHGRRLQRHLTLRREAAQHVYATTAIPFLQRVGMVTAGPPSTARAHGPLAGSLVPLEEGFAEPVADTGDPEQQEISLTQTAGTTAAVDEVSPALIQVDEVSALPGDTELNAKEGSPRPADLIHSDEPDAQTMQTAQSRKVEPAIPAKPAARRSTLSEPARAPADGIAVPVQPRPAQHSEPTRPMLRTDQSELGTATEKTASSQNIPAVVPLTAKTTGAPSAPNSANQVAEGVSSSGYVPDALAPVSPPEIAQVQPDAEQPSPSSPKPEATPIAISRRRAQIQEGPAELKPQTVATQKQPRPAKSQARVGSPPKPSSAADPTEEEVDAAGQELFVPREDVDRSPAAWRERLAEAIRVESENERQQAFTPPAQAARNVSRDPLSPAKLAASRSADRSAAPLRRISPQPGRLPESARRFLNPLVGFDTRDIPIHQGPAVSRVLAASGADAMAADDSILLGPGHDAEAPKTLGVLAHELTHIARGRTTRFVPPVVRDATARKSTSSLPDTTVPETADEEGLALQVESQVQQAAKREAPTSATGITRTATRLAFPRSASSPAPQSEVSPDSPGPEESWGGLPAPWDPMPEWVSAPPTAHPTPVVSAPSVVPSGSAPAVAAAESAAPARAESGRSLLEAEAPHEGGGHDRPEEKKHAGPDLDALARQVYTIVRRRLAADRRREFMQ